MREIAYITASIGIAMTPQGSAMPDELLKKADQAMYVAKKSGRDRYSFELINNAI